MKICITPACNNKILQRKKYCQDCLRERKRLSGRRKINDEREREDKAMQYARVQSGLKLIPNLNYSRCWL